MQYYVGEFDGGHFRQSKRHTLWITGTDNYAAVTFPECERCHTLRMGRQLGVCIQSTCTGLQENN